MPKNFCETITRGDLTKGKEEREPKFPLPSFPSLTPNITRASGGREKEGEQIFPEREFSLFSPSQSGLKSVGDRHAGMRDAVRG